MTREEALKILRYEMQTHIASEVDLHIAMGMAIEALEGLDLTEEYAKAVRSWLVGYQVKCADLKGRYTPYEVLGWIVADWRHENEIW